VLADAALVCYDTNVKRNRFKEIEHTADIAIQVWGSDLPELFVNAAYGMACQLTDAQDVDVAVERRIDVEGEDLEIVMVEWLGELLYLGERDGVVFTEFDILAVTSRGLRAVARGGAVETYHGHIKAVTFSELEITRTDSGYETTIVFDV
jgi:SHS2 domain-containing protein